VSALTDRAPGKVNLCLFVGPTRPDGLHELVSVVQPLDLADELRLESADADEVICEGVEGENLAARALDAYREAAGLPGHWRLTIDKRIPVAAGMGGGSSDAAATLRLAARAAGRPGDPQLERIARTLGADVPALLDPRPKLVTGAGEEVRALPVGGSPAGEDHYVIVPLPHRLSAADVYAEADRLGISRSSESLVQIRQVVETELAAGGLPLLRLRNDLEHAARSLCPAIDDALSAVAQVASRAIVSGSGPTVFGVLSDRADAEAAAQALRKSFPGATAAGPAGLR
jgi:4-diphosphocytidyl-2-C-methyl-D-erythritol kinase